MMVMMSGDIFVRSEFITNEIFTCQPQRSLIQKKLVIEWDILSKITDGDRFQFISRNRITSTGPWAFYVVAAKLSL